MSLNYEHKNIEFAKKMRKDPTAQENHLWYDFLAKYKPRFQRQKPIDKFIVDFYCSKAKLIIEIDGAQHYSEKGMKKDEIRTEKLAERDLIVIRIPNWQINNNFNRVCEYIDLCVKNIMNMEK